jgi:hypothetical protein
LPRSKFRTRPDPPPPITEKRATKKHFHTQRLLHLDPNHYSAAALSEEAFALEAGILASNEAWAKKPGSGGGNPGTALAAVNKELRFLAANTSNSVWPSSICLRADEGNVLCMKALITGAPHTPCKLAARAPAPA